jgi:voltage-gated potassium channel
MRRMIYDIVETGEKYPALNKAYSVFMLCCIALSIIPLLFKEITPAMIKLDSVIVWVFIVDYFLRLITADLKYEMDFRSFIKYPFSAIAIIDLLSILPSLGFVHESFKVLRVVRMHRYTRVFRIAQTLRIFKVVRYTRSTAVLAKVLRDSKDALIIVCILAIGYILSTALIMFNVEPQTFNSFFDAVYWATVSLTTVGYGDIYSVTVAGRLISMISSFVGIAIVALPSCIITAAFVKELNSDDSVNFDGLYLYDNSNKHDDRGGCEGCDKYDSCDKSSDE